LSSERWVNQKNARFDVPTIGEFKAQSTRVE
jgi:hypothetical protein